MHLNFCVKMEIICDNCKYAIEVICVDNNLIECINEESMSGDFYWSKRNRCVDYEENKVKSRDFKLNKLLNGR